MDKTIFYVARGGLPINAVGIRISQIGKLFNAIGYKIHYICNIPTPIDDLSNYDKVIDETLGLIKSENHYQFEGNIYSYLPVFDKNVINSIKSIVELLTARKEFERVEYYLKIEKPEIIILYNDPFGLTKRLVPYCRDTGIKLIGDITEWYEKKGKLTLGNKLISYLVDYRIRTIDFQLDGVIVISHYLYQYYKEHNVLAIWIPSIVPIPAIEDLRKHRANKETKIVNIIYAGFPGNKDILIPFIEAIRKVNIEKLKIKFDIIGIDKAYFEHIKYQINNFEKYGIFIHGRINHEKVIKYIERADFSILLRHNKRYAKAGFSTKFAECMSYGVPMICNRIGGTDVVIKSWENGILIEEANEEEILNVLYKILEMPYEDILLMQETAYNDASKIFSGDTYINSLELFIKDGL